MWSHFNENKSIGTIAYWVENYICDHEMKIMHSTFSLKHCYNFKVLGSGFLPNIPWHLLTYIYNKNKNGPHTSKKIFPPTCNIKEILWNREVANHAELCTLVTSYHACANKKITIAITSHVMTTKIVVTHTFKS